MNPLDFVLSLGGFIYPRRPMLGWIFLAIAVWLFFLVKDGIEAAREENNDLSMFKKPWYRFW